MSLPAAVRLPAYVLAAQDLRDNPGQWQAYKSKENCVVLAGPGSGKSKTLTIKLARMLAEDIQPPRGMGCITYNSECAGELKRRLEKLGVYESRNVFIGTIHSFCLKNVVLPYARLAGLEVAEQIAIALPSDQGRFFEDALAEVFGPRARPSDWRTEFDKYRRTHIDRDVPAWRTDDEKLASLVETYEAALRRNNMVDFDDMVLLGLRVIEKYEWVRRCIRARFPILAIDEYQDLGLPLHRMVMALCFGAGIRVFAVGDPDQSIYGFAGAKPELLKTLSNDARVEKVHLRFNYRSGQRIIDASEVALGEKRGYESKGGYAGTIDFYKCPEGLPQQARRICEEIIPGALKRRNGRTLGDIAVLYTDKNDGDVIEAAVRAANLKFIRIDRGAPYAKTPLTRWLEDCAAWCAGGWRTGVPRLSMLIRTWEGLNQSVRTETALHALKVSLVRFLFSHRSPGQLARDWLSEAKGAILDNTLKKEPTLRDESAAFTNLLRVCGKEGKLAELTVATLGGQAGSSEHLNLITLHSAKGLEFDVVSIMGMDQGKMPSWSARTPESKREARRLFYVGITRARHEIHIAFSGYTVDRYGRPHVDGPSEFVIEVAKRLKEQREQSDSTKSVNI